MKFINACCASLLLFACSSPDHSGRIESLKVFETCAMNACAQGEEQLGMMEYLAIDKSNSESYSKKLKQLFNTMKHADSLSNWLISELNSIRSGIVGQNSPQVNQAYLKLNRPNQPISLEYTSNIELNTNALPNADRVNTIIKEIEIYRDELCRALIESQLSSLSQPQKSYSFKAKKVRSFKNQEEKTSAIQKALKSSRINEDDMNKTMRIMELLTEEKSTWESMLNVDQDLIDLSMGLLSVQQKLLTARFVAFKGIYMRIGCRADLNVTKYTPIILGSTNALPNDTVQFEVLFVAYNEYFDHKVSAFNGTKFIRYEGGKALFEAVAPNSGELKIEGEIMVQNKAGYSQPRKWSHTIKVLEPE